MSIREEIAAIIASAAAKAGHHIRGTACTDLGCAGCALARKARGEHPQLELGEVVKPKQRSREPGEEG
jgi:hypothetical protein